MGIREAVKLLFESGAFLNVIKNGAIQKNHPRHHEKTEFFMGNDRPEARETVRLSLENTRHSFVVVPDNFPLPEADIAGNPCLHSYGFNLTNRSLQLKGRIYLLEDNAVLIPKNSIKFITLKTKKKEGKVIIEDNPYIPDSIYCVRDSKLTLTISNEHNNDLKLATSDIKYKYKTTNLNEELINYLTRK